jgi:hypothetical protein
MLVATIMFQRRQDQQILRVLQGISKAQADEISRPRRLLRLVDESTCPHVKSNDALRNTCDLTKEDGVGACSQRPHEACHLKRHTVTLKRYGHFGKVPSSAALVLRERGVDSLEALKQQVIEKHADPLERSLALEREVSAIWRVSEKVSAMYLSALSNPDLNPGAPWADDLDWTYFVVIDSNVDLFLTSIGYSGGRSYADRRSFVQKLAQKIDLREFRPDVRSYNPRIVQQALYLFMSRANRRSIATDCSQAAKACTSCPKDLIRRCTAKPPSVT